MTAHPIKAGSLFRRFVRDERGVALILVTVMLPVLIGFSLLAIDMSRVNNLHNDLQKAADAFALAAAAELDSGLDAHDRAERALLNLVQNSSRFSDDGTHILTRDGDITWRFLEDLPANDADPIPDDPYLSEGAVETRFIEVTVTPTGFSSIFPASFLGGADTFNVGSVAVAGFDGVVTCEMTPLFMCNPFEGMIVDGEELTFHQAANSEEFYGRGLRLVSKGGDGQWGPGNFGFLRPSSDPGYGANELASDIARSHLNECATTRGLYVKTGVPNSAVEGAINVRFDIYTPGNSQFPRSDSTIPPAPNVRKGFQAGTGGGSGGAACNTVPAPVDSTTHQPLTQDLTTEPSFPRLGTGDWSYMGYLTANNLLGIASDPDFVDDDLQPYTEDNPPSRYDLYMFELAHPEYLNQPSGDGVTGETGPPACHVDANEVLDPERRLIYGAIVNCIEHRDLLNGSGGSDPQPIPAVGYASFFLTEPVDQSRTGGDVMAEIVDIDGNEGRGTMINFARDNVQLYR